MASDFLSVVTFENPIGKKYQEKIEIGLRKFLQVYVDFDTEDRERVCSYIQELIDIVELESSNGQLNTFIYGIDPN